MEPIGVHLGNSVYLQELFTQLQHLSSEQRAGVECLVNKLITFKICLSRLIYQNVSWEKARLLTWGMTLDRGR